MTLNNIGIFQIRYEKIKTKNGKGRTITKKRYLYLDNYTYTTSLDLYQKSKAMNQRYANLNDVVEFYFDTEEGAYITFNTSKKLILLYPIKDRLQ